MKKGDYISKILLSKKTVFTFKDIILLWKEKDYTNARKRISYYLEKQKLYPIRKGFYSKGKDYNKLELATRIYTPSYVSFETVLNNEGVNFQYYTQIFIASYLSREIKVDNQKYRFRKIKNSILTNVTGIDNKGEYMVASKERAFLDMIYLSPSYYFDNIDSLDWNKVFEILPIYNNKRMIKEVNKLYKLFKLNKN